MKIIAAVIKHFKLDDVRNALTEAGIEGMTIVEVKGFGRQKGHFIMHGEIKDDEVNFLPKIKIEVAVPDEKVDEVVNRISESARTGEIGDGKIFVYSMKNVVRIRTGEKDEDAIR